MLLTHHEYHQLCMQKMLLEQAAHLCFQDDAEVSDVRNMISHIGCNMVELATHLDERLEKDVC